MAISNQSLRLGVSLGDPAGIGPEITCKALALFLEDKAAKSLQEIILTGPDNDLASILEVLTPLAQKHPLTLRAVGNGCDFKASKAQPSKESGQHALMAMQNMVSLAKQQQIDAWITAPVSKEALAMANSPYLGHTEMLQALLLKNKHLAMAFTSPSLAVVLATIHVPLSKVSEYLHQEQLMAVVKLFNAFLKDCMGIASPAIAVAGLNPHAGEAGLLGQEEQQIIAPAIAALQQQAINVTGPWPADSLFPQARYDFFGNHPQTGRFHGVVAMYHDQGLIPLKLLHFHEAVQNTLGLTIVRTSPDHGTAYDIATQNKADPRSMLAALHQAVFSAKKR